MVGGRPQRFIRTHVWACCVARDGCRMLHLASVPTIAGRPPPFLTKNGTAFLQSLTGPHLAFLLPRLPHRMLASGCSLLRPEQSWALAADPGPAGLPTPWLAASLCTSALASHTHGFSVRKAWGAHPHTPMDHFGLSHSPPGPGQKGTRCDPEGLGDAFARSVGLPPCPCTALGSPHLD